MDRTIILPHFCSIDFLLQMTNTNSWRLSMKPPANPRCTIKSGHRPLYVVLSKVGDHLVFKYSGKRIEVKLVKIEQRTLIQSVNQQLIRVMLGEGIGLDLFESQVLNETIKSWDRSMFSPLLSHFLMKQERAVSVKPDDSERNTESPPKKRKLNECLQERAPEKHAVLKRPELDIQHEVEQSCYIPATVTAIQCHIPATVTRTSKDLYTKLKEAVNTPAGDEKHATAMDVDLVEKQPKLELHCVCRKPDDKTQPMICCDFCNEWYHGPCVGLTGEMLDEMEDQKFKCPPCLKND